MRRLSLACPGDGFIASSYKDIEKPLTKGAYAGILKKEGGRTMKKRTKLAERKLPDYTRAEEIVKAELIYSYPKNPMT